MKIVSFLIFVKYKDNKYKIISCNIHLIIDLHIIHLFFFLLDEFTNANASVQLITRFSQHEISGSILFSQHSLIEDIIIISVTLNNFGEPSLWSWKIKEFPVDYSILTNRCTDQNLGNK